MSRSLLRFTAKLILLGALSASLAWADSPRRTGLAGAGRSGITNEPLFSNPAALAYLEHSEGFGFYGFPRIKDWGAGGRQITAGIYDGENQIAKAGFAYERDARAILQSGASRAYRDRSNFLFGLGQHITRFLDLGLTGKYIVRRDGSSESTKFFNGDVGALVKEAIIPGAQIGFTYENALNKEGELPPIAAFGVRYDILGPMAAHIDGAMATQGEYKNKKQWSYALEMGLAEEISIRGGLYQDSIGGIRGKSLGVSWQGPRTSFDYGLKISRNAPVQREHVVGMTIQL